MDQPKQAPLQQETPKLNRHQRRAEIATLKKKLGKIRAAQNLRNQQKNRKKKGKRNGLTNKDWMVWRDWP